MKVKIFALWLLDSFKGLQRCDAPSMKCNALCANQSESFQEHLLRITSDEIQ